MQSCIGKLKLGDTIFFSMYNDDRSFVETYVGLFGDSYPIDNRSTLYLKSADGIVRATFVSRMIIHKIIKAK